MYNIILYNLYSLVEKKLFLIFSSIAGVFFVSQKITIFDVLSPSAE
jgi:hypothetical protein